MPELDLNRRHPEFKDRERLVDFLLRSYVGGEMYDAEMFLDQYPRERSDIWEARKERAYYINLVAAVVDQYISEIFRREVTREVASSLNSFVEDADSTGTELTDFVREAMTYALACMGYYVVVDVNAFGDPYCHLLHPANLLDWDIDAAGNFTWALTAEEYEEAEDPFEPRVLERRYRLWTPREFFVFDENAREVDKGRNTAGIVPIIEVTPGEMPLSMYDIARIAKRVFNICSQIDEILVNNTFPQLYTFSDEPIVNESGEQLAPDISPLEVGTSRMLELPIGAQPPGYVAPPEGPVKMHVEERERLIKSIYSTAGLGRKDPDEQNVQSGVAKAYDFKETNARLSAIAQEAENLEKRIFAIVEAYGITGFTNVTYVKNYDVREFTELLDSTVKIAFGPFPVEAKRRAVKDAVGQIVEDAEPDERNQIAQAVDAMPDEAFVTVAPSGQIVGAEQPGVNGSAPTNGSVGATGATSVLDALREATTGAAAGGSPATQGEPPTNEGT